MIVLGFADYRAQAERLAHTLELSCREIAVHRFPDGESRVTVPTGLPQQVILCRSLDHPDHKLIELLLAVGALREQGVERIILVAPYLCYMRQDMAFHPGEAVSQRLIGRFLADLVDALVTVDPHLHRIDRLEQAVPIIQAVTLSATDALGEYLAARWERPVLVGPDSESAQWVRAIAEPRGLEWTVAEKHRSGDREVSITLPDLDVRDRQVVLIDDMASTARTLSGVAGILAQQQPAGIAALVTHALFDDRALAEMHAAGITIIASSDSVSHPSNAVRLAGLLAAGIRPLLGS
jgi:ribose-phosphate pyrophosphokinase